MSQKDTLGRFTFVLHSHLPYVLSHGNWPHGMVWLSEAAAETYIPLWRTFQGLHDEGRNLAVTIGFSPVLAEQLRDSTFVTEFETYLHEKREAAERDIRQFEEEGRDHLAKVARFWVNWYSEVEKDFKGPLDRDIVGAFKKLQDDGAIEIITCGATHGYLPLLGTDEAVNAQVELAVNTYEKHFGRKPRGIWLPECAYRPGYHWINPTSEDEEGFDRKGVEYFLKKHGLRFFIVDSHLIEGGKAMGTYLARFEGLKKLWEQSQKSIRDHETEVPEQHEPYRVYWVDETVGEGDPVGVLTRDPKTSLQVWSGEWGYPGDGNYLDFHKKHFPGGHRYWRVTRAQADLGEKEEYDPECTEARLQENANHFVGLVHEVMESSKTPAKERILVTPFDTELFGHWWYEGPRWLGKVLAQIDEAERVEPAHGGDLVVDTDEAPVVALPEGSWGEGGFHYVWLNEKTKWSWSLIHECETQMTELVRKHKDAEGEELKILQQLGRELLLLESSDWQFLISTIAAADYAELRIRTHYNDFQFVRGYFETVSSGQETSFEDRQRFEQISSRDCLFENLDLSLWA
jgi:1,4-alpha-glucan branching enzyme